MAIFYTLHHNFNKHNHLRGNLHMRDGLLYLDQDDGPPMVLAKPCDEEIIAMIVASEKIREEEERSGT